MRDEALRAYERLATEAPDDALGPVVELLVAIVRAQDADLSRLLDHVTPQDADGLGLRTFCDGCGAHANRHGACSVCGDGRLKHLTHGVPARRVEPPTSGG